MSQAAVFEPIPTQVALVEDRVSASPADAAGTATCSRAELVSREPWWAEPPRAGQDEAELTWGYLEIYRDGTFRFDPSRPSDEEIRNRPGCRVW